MGGRWEGGGCREVDEIRVREGVRGGHNYYQLFGGLYF